MILARMLRYNAKRKWNIVQVDPQRVLIVKKTDTSWFVDVVKEHNSAVNVSMPVKDVRCKMTFGSEMHAYEYLEDLMLDNNELMHYSMKPEDRNKLYSKKRKSDCDEDNRIVRQRTSSL